MKNNITQKVKTELKNLIDTKGYWSTEVREYISQFQYDSSRKLHDMAIAYDKYKKGELIKKL